MAITVNRSSRFKTRLLSVSFCLFGSLLPLGAQLLWKVSGQNLSQASYLFGTIHIAPEDRFVVWPAVDSAFRNSKLLVMELDLDLSASEMIQAARQMSLPAGRSLADYLPPASYAAMRDYCLDSLGWKNKKFKRCARMKPFYFSSLVLSEQLGKVSGYEQYFSKQAKRLKMPVRGLETMQEQLDAVDAISVLEQASMLSESLHAGKKEFDSMLDLYLNRDLVALGNLMKEEGAGVDGFTETMLTKRNQNWMLQLKALLPEQALFTAVGAGHLPGAEGLIELLRKEGFTVEPIW
jgi:uncharacterized protein YbaP (TraB family)